MNKNGIGGAVARKIVISVTAFVFAMAITACPNSTDNLDAPDAVTGLSITFTGAITAELSWTNPTENFTHVEISEIFDDGSASVIVASGVKSDTYPLTGFYENDRTFSVTAVGAGGKSAPAIVTSSDSTNNRSTREIVEAWLRNPVRQSSRPEIQEELPLSDEIIKTILDSWIPENNTLDPDQIIEQIKGQLELS